MKRISSNVSKMHFWALYLLLLAACTGNTTKREEFTHVDVPVEQKTSMQTTKSTSTTLKSETHQSVTEMSEDDSVDRNSIRGSMEHTYSWNADSIYATKVYEFNYADGIFPCQETCVVKGIDTDGNGIFYIAGGNPIRVVCYDGTKFCWSRELSRDTASINGFFHLVKDSLYFIEETNHKVLRMHKDGGGDIDSFVLSGFPSDNKMYCGVGYLGKMTDDYYIIETYYSVRAYKYLYPAMCIDSVDHKDTERFCLIRPQDMTVKVSDYKGKYGAWNVYTSGMEDADASALYDDECGEEPGVVVSISADTQDFLLFIQLPVGGLPPYAPKTRRGAVHSSHLLEPYRNGKLYFAGYYPQSQKFQIHEFELGKLLQNMNLHSGYISDYER